jgi:hypothetical protein
VGECSNRTLGTGCAFEMEGVQFGTSHVLLTERQDSAAAPLATLLRVGRRVLPDVKSRAGPNTALTES